MSKGKIGNNSGYFKKVYEITKKIPKGKVTTYGQIAEVIQNLKVKSQSYFKISPQLVGWALHANKSSNVPCHRVVDRNGRVAPNFAFDGWREQKRRLLEEGVVFVDEMHVDLKNYLWKP